MLNPKTMANGQERQNLKKQKSRYGKENNMNEMEKLYEAYAQSQSEREEAPQIPEYMNILLEMLPHKEYMEVEAAISTAIIENEKECFIAGFKAATRLFMSAVK
jgi:uncharacterized Ntn-hydrolase superfamily protein